MWVILPAVSLAMVHIAGDNLAVVPDMAVILGAGIYATTFFAYMICGAIITGISAWIGVKTGQELMIVVRKIFGCTGKKLLALSIVAICIPASALTGGYFSGSIIHMLTGMPQPAAALVCVAGFALMASGWGWGEEILRCSNYVALLLMPAVIVMVLLTASSASLGISPTMWLSFAEIDWMLVLALIGYNAGGMRPALVVEAAAYWTRKKNKAVVLAVIAKIFEGAFTLLIAHLVLTADVQGPMALSGVAGKLFGVHGHIVFNLLLLATFITTMVPAMMVNARQIGVLTGLTYTPALFLAAVIVYIGSCIDFTSILLLMSGTGLFMTLFIIVTACAVHKLSRK
ncbi:MAG: hypothetical protein N2491_05915 [Negativicutes bacterium]|nr:hypothetical protein [Negativicutes bacterium]